MVEEFPPTAWFLEVQGQKTGPFTTEQILGLYADGELPGTAKIISSEPDAEWSTVAQFISDETDDEIPSTHVPIEIEDVRTAPAIQRPASIKPFTPPPRPSEVSQSHEAADPETLKGSKDEMSLLDALIAAKERKAGRAIPPENVETTPNPFDPKNIPAKAWVVVGTAALLAVSTWGLTHFIRQKSSSNPQAAAFSPPSASPFGVQAQNPPAFVPPPSAPPIPTAASLNPVNPVNPVNSPFKVSAPNTSSLAANAELERQREREREAEQEREREHEREREIASNTETSNANSPPPPPIMPPGSPPQMPPPGVPDENLSAFNATGSTEFPAPPPAPPPPLPPTE